MFATVAVGSLADDAVFQLAAFRNSGVAIDDAVGQFGVFLDHAVVINYRARDSCEVLQDCQAGPS